MYRSRPENIYPVTLQCITNSSVLGWLTSVLLIVLFRMYDVSFDKMPLDSC